MSKSNRCDKCGKLLTMFGNCVDCYQPCEPAATCGHHWRMNVHTRETECLMCGKLLCESEPDDSNASIRSVADQAVAPSVVGSIPTSAQPSEPASPKPESDEEWARGRAIGAAFSDNGAGDWILVGIAEGRRRERERKLAGGMWELLEEKIREREEAAAREAWEAALTKYGDGDPGRYFGYFNDWWKQRRAGK